MTFDDGPNEGTPYVLDALKRNGVRYNHLCFVAQLL